MPAPRFLSRLPKPLLFGLYGALGAFAGTLLLVEPLHLLLDPVEKEVGRGLPRLAFLVARVALNLAALAVPMCLAILVGQHHYLRGRFPPAGVVGSGALGGLTVGAVSGGAAQVLYLFAPDDRVMNAVIRTAAWALFGGLAGGGLAKYIPNLKQPLGATGGAVGGAIGCLGFLAAGSVLGDTAGRLVGFVVVGFCIGVMVVVAEAVFRRAWLEVKYGPREVIRVTLGPEPVKVGGDAGACTVWARGAPAVALRFFVRDGRVICHDPATRAEEVAGDGFSREVGNVTVTVRMSGAEPVRRPAPNAAPAARGADDEPEPRLPRATKPAAPPPPRVTTAPPAKPAIKPAARNPNACPGCGRVVAGQPGARYCMVCDQTF